MNNKFSNSSKSVILGFIVATFIMSCSKERNDVFVEPTALKFTQKESTNLPNFKYKYTMLKYNNFWYSKTLPDGVKQTTTDILKFTIYSNNEKPMNQWIGYVDWMRDTTIVTFSNPGVDSIPQYTRFEVAEGDLFKY